MEPLEKEEIDSKLILLLKKITESKSFESSFGDKFLIHLSNAFSCGHYNNLLTHELVQWLSETLQSWRQSGFSISEAIFVSRVVGTISKNEQGFYNLQSVKALDELCTFMQHVFPEKRCLISSYIKLLSDTLGHSLGYKWIKTSQQWKLICSLYFSNSNLYVEREGQNFLKNLINRAIIDDEIIYDIFKEIFSPIIKYNEANILDKNFCSHALLIIRLLESVLKMNIFKENHFFYLKLEEVFDINMFLNFLLMNSTDENMTVAASALQILFFVAKHPNKEELLVSLDYPLILDTFYTLLKRNMFDGIIKLSKYCQILWNNLEVEIKGENKSGVTFICFQFLPLISFIKPPDTAECDLFIQKVNSMVSPEAQKLCFVVRDEFRSQMTSKPEDLLRLALKGVLSVAANTECLNLEEAIIIFQAMAYTLKAFVFSNYEGELTVDYSCTKVKLPCIPDSRLLSSVLNALCVFIQKFKINWPKAVESLCLLTLCCILLKQPDLSSIVVVQAFLLVKLTILNFMTPDLALLLNNTKDSAFDCLLPLLHKHMHDPRWEVRDSCLEVVTLIAELGETKYPAFQQTLVEKKFYSLVVDMMEGDSESYVRASAIQALTAMIKIEALNEILFKMECPRKVIKLLQNESEAIVRREAVLLIKQIYLTVNDFHDEILNSLYEIMGYLAICDLHWEVKVNSLIFWEAVIQRTMADQGMIDGSFPKVTFSKENKKIVNLTENEVKLRLEKVLLKLSKIGCLHVLLSTLNEDCDIQVIEKSAQVLADLKIILKNYGVLGFDSVFPMCEKASMKRKNTIFNKCEKKKTHSLIEENKNFNEKTESSNEPCNSDVVIDSIINETDFNLLVTVSSQNEKKVNSQKKILLEVIEPEEFISELQDLDIEKFVEDKHHWLQYNESGTNSILPKKSVSNIADETNIMDCY